MRPQCGPIAHRSRRSSTCRLGRATGGGWGTGSSSSRPLAAAARRPAAVCGGRRRVIGGGSGCPLVPLGGKAAGAHTDARTDGRRAPDVIIFRLGRLWSRTLRRWVRTPPSAV